MIISHKYRYLFVELPRTGSTAISKELRLNYDGQKILRKHSTYLEFLKQASDDEKTYFVFSCIRNPIDDAVSQYFKAKGDHHGRFSDGRAGDRMREQYHFIDSTAADFATYFRTFFRLPYANWSILSHKDFNFVIRFENLASDFDRALRLIGIEPVRPLPVVNKTEGRDVSYLRYYTPEIIPYAKWVFGPYMKLWGYEFPREWGEVSVSTLNQLTFDTANVVRRWYWSNVQQKPRRRADIKAV